VRLTTPGSWYDGEWTIASLPTTDSVRITSGINPISAGPDGTAYSNTKADVMHTYYGLTGQDENTGGQNFEEARLYEGRHMEGRLIQEADKLTPSAFPWERLNSPGGTASEVVEHATENYVDGSGEWTNIVKWPLDSANFDDIRQIALRFGASSTGKFRNLNALIEFDELQRKDSGYELQLTVVRSLEQTLA